MMTLQEVVKAEDMIRIEVETFQTRDQGKTFF